MAKHRRRWSRLFASLLFVILVASYICYALLQPVAAVQPDVTFSYTHAAVPASLAWPTYGSAAVGAVGYGVLDTHGEATPIPTASTIKILTALTVLHVQPLQLQEAGPTITLTQADVDSYNKFVAADGSVVKVTVGEQLSEYQALQALLLPSANNIAETLARWAYGSLDDYLASANQYARSLGMTATTVTDPSGFAPTTVSTPRDLVILAETAMANPIIREIVQQTSATIPVQGVIHNVDFLLGKNNIVGIKTGNNDQNPGCFLGAATYTIGGQQLTVVSVIMNGPNLGSVLRDSVPLLESIKDNFTVLHAANAGTTVATYTAPWQGTIAAVTEQDITAVVWKNSSASLSIHVNNLDAPQKKHAEIGYAELSATGKKTATSPIELQQQLSEPSPLWRLVHPE